MLTSLFAKEPVLATLGGSAIVWAALFKVLSAYGVHLTPDQQSAFTALFVAVAGVIARSQVSPVSK